MLTTELAGEERRDIIVATATVLFLMSFVPYLGTLWFYFKIYRYARHLMAMETTIMDDHVIISPRTSFDRRMVRYGPDSGGQHQEPIVDAILDDSIDDDDLIDLNESQSMKQVLAVIITYTCLSFN